MFWYCFALIWATFFFFLLSIFTAAIKEGLDEIWFSIGRVPIYFGLLFVYYIFKWILKRRARRIDAHIIVANFSFEILTEILMSSLYWCNFRMLCLRHKIYYESNTDHWDDYEMIVSYVASICLVIAHIGFEVFQDYFRMTAGYFNCKCACPCPCSNDDEERKKSNITQWKVRGAIDTSIRFIISVYSFVFIFVLFAVFEITYESGRYPKGRVFQRQALILNLIIFVIEICCFVPIIFKPGFAGKISDQQQINMAEPLMRMYNAKRSLFTWLFCGLVVMASLLVF